MAHGERAPGEKLAIRLSTRLRRADGLLVASRLATRLSRRSAPDRTLGSAVSQRMERWQASPMLRWATATLDGSARPRWGLMVPEFILTAPAAEPVEDFAGSPVPRRRGRARSAAVERRSSSRRVPTEHGPVPRSADLRPLQPGEPLAFPWAAPITAGVQPWLVPPVAQSAPAAPHRHSELRRARARTVQQPAPSPVRSHWAGRVLGPAPAPVRPGARPWRGPSAPQAVLAEPDQPGTPDVQPASTAVRYPRRTPSGPPAAAARPRTGGHERRAHSAHRTPYADVNEPPDTQHRAGGTAASGRVGAALGGLHRRTEPFARLDPLAASDAPEQATSRSSSLPEAAPAGRVAAKLDQHPSRGVILALARAGSQERAAQVAVAHADQLINTQGLPGPLADLARQLGQEIRRASSAKQVAKDPVVAKSASRPSAAQERAHRQLAKVVRSSESAPVVSLASQRLIRRLQNLVHIAEFDRRVLEAQRQVRMAEDSAQARAEGAAAANSDGEGNVQPVDLDTLGREVLSAVTSLSHSRTVRRPEDPDVPVANF